MVKLPKHATLMSPRRPVFTTTNSRVFRIDGILVRIFTSQRIRYLRPNPKTAGCAAHSRYEKYMHAKTIAEALSLGSAEGDLLHDLKQGFLTFTRLRCVPYEKLPSYGQDNIDVKSKLEAHTAERARKTFDSLSHKREKHRQKVTALWKRRWQESQSSTPKRRRMTLDLVNGHIPSPHEYSTKSAADYQVVVLSYPHEMRIDILRSKTLNLLKLQKVDWRRIHLIVASETEKTKYAESLGAEAPQILVAKRGVVAARDWIVNHFAEGVHVVSLDDDVEDIQWLHPSTSTVVSLPPGGFDGLVRHARALMESQSSYIWGLNISDSSLNLQNTISRKNGLVCGNFYGFLNRPSLASKLRPKLGQAAEDCERSIRYFARDGLVLRYMMYHAVTKPYINAGGLQTQFKTRLERKQAEIDHVESLQRAFPSLVSLEAKSTLRTVSVCFSHLGMRPLHMSCDEDLMC